MSFAATRVTKNFCFSRSNGSLDNWKSGNEVRVLSNVLWFKNNSWNLLRSGWNKRSQINVIYRQICNSNWSIGNIVNNYWRTRKIIPKTNYGRITFIKIVTEVGARRQWLATQEYSAVWSYKILPCTYLKYFNGNNSLIWPMLNLNIR